jgi:hypothetical protein
MEENEIKNQNNNEVDDDELKEIETEEIYFAKPLLLKDKKLILENPNFKKGIDDASYFAGLYSTLISAGMSNKEAFTCLFTKFDSDLTLKINENNNKATVDAAKFVQVTVDKTQP